MASRKEIRVVSTGQKLIKICEVNYIHTARFYYPHSPLPLQKIAKDAEHQSLSGGFKDFVYQAYGLLRLELSKSPSGISS